MYLLKWSERISVAAANMLNRGGETEKIALRKCIDEWCEKLEPELAEKEKLVHAECEQEETKRAHTALSQEERDRFLESNIWCTNKWCGYNTIIEGEMRCELNNIRHDNQGKCIDVSR